MKAVQHFRTITKHKILVMKECFRVGLYRQGLLHDMSKYGWTEFRVGCKYYQGTRSPNNAERETLGYSSAWLHHKGRNKHHYEYWIDYGLDGKKALIGMKMPKIMWWRWYWIALRQARCIKEMHTKILIRWNILHMAEQMDM